MSLRQNIVNDAIIKEIIEKLNTLRYGEVRVSVHNSRITQIEKVEKTRFDDVWLVEKGDGI